MMVGKTERSDSVTKKKALVFRGMLVLAGVSMIGIGIWRGEVDTVWNKAINICLECVGIG